MAYTTINNPELYFQTKAWTGTGNEIAVTFDGSQNMQPDWVWLKKRSAAGIHVAHDSVRGATKRLVPNSTDGETTQAQYVKSFDSNGITFGTDTDINANGATAILWGWKAGNSSGSSNTDGSITSTVSVNTTAGFSICKWAGSGANATIGHGLGAVPKLIITKSMAGSTSWCVYHASLGNTKTIFLESDGSGNTHIAYYNNTSPTSSVFTVGTDSGVNHSGNNMIAYCFAEKTGYSKFGQYTGNENVNGTFVFCGFKPAWVMIKRTNSANHWTMYDNKRLGYNNDNKVLYANETAAEEELEIDLLSNGFKCKNTDNKVNGSGNPYIFMAFAEEPLVANVGSSGVPATAR